MVFLIVDFENHDTDKYFSIDPSSQPVQKDGFTWIKRLTISFTAIYTNLTVTRYMHAKPAESGAENIVRGFFSSLRDMLFLVTG